MRLLGSGRNTIIYAVESNEIMTHTINRVSVLSNSFITTTLMIDEKMLDPYINM